MTGNAKKELSEVVALFHQYLEQEKEKGTKSVKYSPSRVPVPGIAPAPHQGQGKGALLRKLEDEIKDCRKCGLHSSRISVVFGQGNPDARLMFVGEGPGYDEDRQGSPFVGKAGQLLTKMIEAMKMKREEVYIANIVKCHPMKNPSHPEMRGNDRAPEYDEIQACLPVLMKQIEVIKPQVICTLGSPATKTLLGISGDKSYDGSSITRVRGQFFNFKGSRLIPTFHPAFLLRYPEKKKEAWEDMKKIMSELKIKLKGEINGKS